MEKRIKTLYMFTAAAIIGLIAVQIIWLYKQYNVTLDVEQEKNFKLMGLVVQKYNDIRKLDTSYNDSTTIAWSNTNIDYKSHGSKQTSTVTNSFYMYKVTDLLGLPDTVDVTSDMRTKARELINFMEPDSDHTDVKRLEVHDMPLKTNVWDMADEITLDHNSPFTIEGVDSVMKQFGMIASVSLTTVDSLMIDPEIIKDGSFFRHEIKGVFPYVALEHKVVRFTMPITVASVVKSMGVTLVVSMLLSVFLIVCLIWQIRTIKMFVRLDSVRTGFVHTMIHELKRPVSTLKLCISSLDNPKLVYDDNSRTEILDDCRMAVNNLSTYFSRLRDITFNEASQIPLDVETFVLYNMVEEAIAKTHLPSDKCVELVNDVGRDVSITADKLHLSQMVGNLIENAVKYSGESVRIRFGCEYTEGHVAICVSDTGTGIADSDVDKIFEKFYRATSAMQSGLPGVGLGLAYVKLLAEAHGGRVEVVSRIGEGSTFTINLPQ